MYNIFNLSIDIQSMIYRNYKKSNHWNKTLKTINQVRSHYIWLFEATVTFCYVIVYYYITRNTYMQQPLALLTN